MTGDTGFLSGKRDSRARLRLFCFPYAGGGVWAFAGWQAAMPAGVEVCPIHLPGRDPEIPEPPARRMGPLVSDLVDALETVIDRPYALFGHSMGAWIAFELARELRRRGQSVPAQMFASAARAPHEPDPDPLGPELPDDEFLETVQQRYGGVPPAVADHPEFRSFFLPLMRADFELLAEYRHAAEPPLDCPLSVYGGTEDEAVSDSSLAAWQRHVSGRFMVRQFPGGHLFIRTERAAVTAAVGSDLRRVLYG